MDKYDPFDLRDKEKLLVRPIDIGRNDPLAYCTWDYQAWEAEYFAHTPEHEAQRDKHINLMRNHFAWFKISVKADTRALRRNNQARGTKKRKIRHNDENDV